MSDKVSLHFTLDAALLRSSQNGRAREALETLVGTHVVKLALAEMQKNDGDDPTEGIPLD